MAFSLFKKKQKTDDRYQKLRIREVIPIAKEAVNLVFEKPEQSFDYSSGQFLTIIDTVGGEKIRRAYSLCSNPFEDEFPAVTVKRVENGRMSNHINDNYRAGMEVEIMEPMGIFTTEYEETRSRKVVFIGGGSGITPLYSILRSVLLKESGSQVTLIYANRSEEHIIFKDELLALTRAYGDRFRLIHILENDESDLAFEEGRLSGDIMKDVVGSNDLMDAEFYICGPEPMMDIAKTGLESIGITQDKIRIESFEAGITSPKELVSEDQNEASNVIIILDGEEHMVPVSKGASILETALDAGLDMPYSCQSGLCTACRGKCLEGDITTEDAEGLSQDELNDGYRLLCIGKPLSDNIKVEVG